jgi:small subunit ribosomal protein S18
MIEIKEKEINNENVSVDEPVVVEETEAKKEDKRAYKNDRNSDSSNRSSRKGQYASKKKFFFKKRVCFFCSNKNTVIDYKDVGLMKRFVSESGKISPRRFTGTCAKHQKKVTVEIKKARQMALLPFTDKHK